MFAYRLYLYLNSKSRYAACFSLSWLRRQEEGRRDQSEVGKMLLHSLLKNTKLALRIIPPTQAPPPLVAVVEQVPVLGATLLNWNGLAPNSSHHGLYRGL